MGIQAEELKARTKRFALNAMALVDRLPRTRPNDYLALQFLRAANAVASNYRAACRARSRAEFASKMGIVAEEADESAHWLEMVSERGGVIPPELSKLLAEAHELEAIFSASYGTARRNIAARSGLNEKPRNSRPG